MFYDSKVLMGVGMITAANFSFSETPGNYYIIYFYTNTVNVNQIFIYNIYINNNII